MTQNALHASDYYVVTAIPDHLSTIGLNILTRKVRDIGNRTSAARTFAGQDDVKTIAELGAIVFVKVRMGGDMTTTTHADRMQTIEREQYARGKVVSTHTTEYIGYSEAAENQVPVWEHGSTNARRAAQTYQYQSITQELINRLG